MATLLLSRTPLFLRAGASASPSAFTFAAFAPARAFASAPAGVSLFRATTVARVGLGASALLAAHGLATGASPLRGAATVRCDAAGAARDFGASVRDGVERYEAEARTPVVSRGGGLNGRAVRQMTVGSMCGESFARGAFLASSASPSREARLAEERSHRRGRGVGE